MSKFLEGARVICHGSIYDRLENCFKRTELWEGEVEKVWVNSTYGHVSYQIMITKVCDQAHRLKEGDHFFHVAENRLSLVSPLKQLAETAE